MINSLTLAEKLLIRGALVDLLQWLLIRWNLLTHQLAESRRLWLSFSLNHEHLLVGTRLASLIILTLLALAQIRAYDSLLVAFTVFLLAERFFAVAAFEVSFLFVTDSQNSIGRRLGRDTQENFALLLKIDLVQFDIFLKEGSLVKWSFNLWPESQRVPHEDLLLG